MVNTVLSLDGIHCLFIGWYTQSCHWMVYSVLSLDGTCNLWYTLSCHWMVWFCFHCKKPCNINMLIIRRTYASSTMSRHSVAETKIHLVYHLCHNSTLVSSPDPPSACTEGLGTRLNSTLAL